MHNFSNQELTDIVLMYGKAGNAAAARRFYGARYPNRVLPNRHTFQSTGSFESQSQDRSRVRPRRKYGRAYFGCRRRSTRY
jgi:hypothetical protein